MLRAAIKNLLGHKLRMFLTGFSIILGVSFVAGTYIFTDSISSTFNNLFSNVFSGIDVTVRPKKAEFGGNSSQTFPEDVLSKIKEIDQVSIAEGGVAGYAQFLGKDGKPLGGQGPPTLGFSWTIEDGLNPLEISEGDGRAPTAPGEVAMDKTTARLGNFAIGDKVKVLLQGPAEEFTLVGIATFGDVDSLAGATLAAFELREAQRVFGTDNTFSEINIKAETNVSAEDLRNQIAAILPENLEAITGQQQSNEQVSEFNSNLSFINTALLAFAGVAVFVGSFIIQNTFRIIVTQRSKELALLRAIGATKIQVVALVMYEAVFVAIISSIAGIAFGLVVSSGVRSIMNSVGFTLPEGPLSVEPRTIIVSMSVGVLVTIFAALLPALKASRVSPVEALRDNEADSTNRSKLFKRSIVGLAVVLLGAGLLVFGLNSEIKQPLYPVGAGVVMMFIGVSTLAPLLSGPLAQIIGWPLTKFRGIPARLAKDNAARTPRRTASTAAALMIGVSLVTMLSILATSFKAQITTILNDSFPADLSVFSKNIGEAGPGTAGFSVEAYETVKNVPELNNVTAIRYKYQGVQINGVTQDFIAGVDVPQFGEVVKLDPTEGSYEGVANGGILVAKKAADKQGWKINDQIEVDFAVTGKQMLTIVGTFNEAYDSDLIIASSVFIENIQNDDVTLIVADARDGIEVTNAKEAARKALEGYPQLDVQDKGDLFNTAEQQIDQILGLFWGLLGFAINIAVLGITNTLMLSISERTKELGMLRAIGMTRSQMRRMIRYESIIIALFGAVLGVAMGAFFAWALIRALASEGITSYVVPVGQILLYFALAIVAGIIAAALPARKAARMNILKAIYHD